MIPRRVLGETGLPVSVLGFGGASIGFAPPGREAGFVPLIRRALDLGVTFLDTAPDYRRSEAWLGEALAGRRAEVVLATKVGRIQTPSGSGWTIAEDWSEAGVLRSVRASLERLGTTYLDLVQLHSPPVEVLEARAATGAALRGLLRAREAGLVRHLGVSADGMVARRALELGVFETLQLSYSLLEQEPGADILPMAADSGVGVIVKQPLANAILGMAARPEPPDWVSKWEVARRMDQALGPPENRQALALRWLLADPRASTVIVGTTRREHLEANAAAIAAGPLLPEEARALGEAYRAARDGLGGRA